MTAKGSRLNYCGVDGVVPVAVERVPGDVHGGELLIADFKASLVVRSSRRA
jgi:hypothetical protein